MKRIFITCTALAALGLALGASRNGVTADTVTERIDHAIHALESVHAPIPHAALHAKALEILRGRTVAAGTDDDDAYARIEACSHFNPEPTFRVNCGREGAK